MLQLIETHVCLRLTVADKTAWPRLCDVVGAEGCACALTCAGSERHAQTARCSEASESSGKPLFCQVSVPASDADAAAGLSTG